MVSGTTVAMRQMYRQHPIAAVSYYMSIVLTVLSPIMALRALVYLPLTGGVNCLPYLAGLFLMYTFLCLFYCYHTQSKTCITVWPSLDCTSASFASRIITPC